MDISLIELFNEDNICKIRCFEDNNKVYLFSGR